MGRFQTLLDVPRNLCAVAGAEIAIGAFESRRLFVRHQVLVEIGDGTRPIAAESALVHCLLN